MNKIEEVKKEIEDDIAVGYTLATGKLFIDMAKFQKFAEDLLDEPISHYGMSNSFSNKALWERLRKAYEDKRITTLKKGKD